MVLYGHSNPAKKTASYLKTSAELNKFPQLQIVTAGLSDRRGTATLFLSDNSELNTLNPSSKRKRPTRKNHTAHTRRLLSAQ